MDNRQSHCVIVGGGRAGRSFEAALTSVGWSVDVVAGRPVSRSEPGEDVVTSLLSASYVLLAVPDEAIAATARGLADACPRIDAVVAHVSGATTLESLDAVAHPASLHPLMSLPDGDVGGQRLLDGCAFAVDGDERVRDLVTALGGRAIAVPADRRACYHAAATVAANHLTALCAQVEVIAAEASVPVDAYWTLMSTTLDNIISTDAGTALTGPAARGDWDTVRRHLAAIPVAERSLYLSAVRRAARLAGTVVPDGLDLASSGGV